MKILTIGTREGDMLLHRHSQSVEDPCAADIHRICSQLKSFVADKKNRAIGLAAVQVGIPLRIFAMRVNARKGFRKEVVVCVNPVILGHSDESVTASEMCLSEPGVFRMVQRSRHVIVEYTDGSRLNSGRRILNASDMMARIIQHEMDHFNGKLLSDIPGEVRG
jgi:peptide deformylase